MTHKTLETEDKVRDEKEDRLLLHPIRRQNRLTARDKNPPKDQVKREETTLDKSEIPCRFKFCKNPSCKFWHILPCVRITCLKKDVYMTTNADMLVQKDQLLY